MTCDCTNYLTRKPLASVTDRTEIEFEVGNCEAKSHHDAAVSELVSAGWHVSYTLNTRDRNGVAHSASIMRRR